MKSRNKLSKLSKKGLETPNVVHSSEPYLIEKKGDVYYANTAGLALIGLFGIEKAFSLSEKTLPELTEEEQPATNEICRSLNFKSIYDLEEFVDKTDRVPFEMDEEYDSDAPPF